MTVTLVAAATAEFQFLIGWLQTVTTYGVKDLYKLVSIPYRLATNKIIESTLKIRTIVSIPYRLATNYTKKASADPSGRCFNSL